MLAKTKKCYFIFQKIETFHRILYVQFFFISIKDFRKIFSNRSQKRIVTALIKKILLFQEIALNSSTTCISWRIMMHF